MPISRQTCDGRKPITLTQEDEQDVIQSQKVIEPLVQGPDQFENPLYYQGLARQLGVTVSAQPTCRMPCVRALFGLRRCPRRVTAQSLAWYQRMVCIDSAMRGEWWSEEWYICTYVYIVTEPYETTVTL